MGWWQFTRSAIDALTAPLDKEAADRAVLDLTRESAIGRVLHASTDIVRASWADSWLRARGVGLSGARTVSRLANTLRVDGWVAVVAGAATLVFNATKPVPAGPMTTLVPAIVIAGGAVVMLMADPLARAAGDSSRHKRS